MGGFVDVGRIGEFGELDALRGDWRFGAQAEFKRINAIIREIERGKSFIIAS
jgi:hypothetical protein